MRKELMAYYHEKWGCVWNNSLTETKNIQNPEEIIGLIKKEYPVTSDLDFYIEDNEIFVNISTEDIKINYGECKIE
jgi:hypothetical protein